MKKVFILVSLFFILWSNGYAQTCTITGNVKKNDGTPNTTAIVKVVRCVGSADGSFIADQPSDHQTDVNGNFSFPLNRNTDCYIYSSAIPEFKKEGGVPVHIPDEDTAILKSLLRGTTPPSYIPVAVSGFEIQEDGVPVSGAISKLNFTSDFGVDQSPTGQANVSIPTFVKSFNTRSGTVNLTSGDVIAALGFTPESAAINHVNTFNGRAGVVALTSGDVIAGVGFTPANKAGDSFGGQVTVPSLVIGSTQISEFSPGVVALGNAVLGSETPISGSNAITVFVSSATTKPFFRYLSTGTGTGKWQYSNDGVAITDVGSGGGGGGHPAGDYGQIQFNVGGEFAASADLTFDATDKIFAVRAVPPASASKSLLRLGNALSGGNEAGTYFGVNTSNTFNGDLVNLQRNGGTVFQVSNVGYLALGGGGVANGILSLTDRDSGFTLTQNSNGSGLWYWRESSVTGYRLLNFDVTNKSIHIGHNTSPTGSYTLEVFDGMNAGVTTFRLKAASGQGSSNLFEVSDNDDNLQWGLDSSYRLRFSSGLTSTTVGAAGGAALLPAAPTGYILINVGGTQKKVPYYDN